MHAAKFVESYFDAWNHGDPEGVADHLTADGIYIGMPENIPLTHDELIVTLNDLFANFPHFYELIGEVLTSRNTIAFQYRAYQMADNDPGQHATPTLYCGAEFMTLDGDAAVKITDYFDIPGQTHQIKYAKSGLRSEKLLRYKQRLDDLMTCEQAYLQSNLTLPVLASAVGCSVNHLSQVINSGFDMSFFDYLNSHRIKHARELLSRTDGESNAILNIAFTVGFNSNSAFYAAFKKHVGVTPAQFRRENMLKSP